MPGEFTATARIPCRPLSYENNGLAQPKELLVDYKTGNIWICKEDNTFVDVGNAVKETIIEQIKEDPDFVQNIQIVIDGETYELSTIVADNVNKIQLILEALGYYVDENTQEIKFDLLDKIASVDDEGNVTFNITTGDITETDDKFFMSQAEKDRLAQATHPEIKKVTILGGSQAWTGDVAPYTQQITVDGILETDTPVVDISLGDIYDTVQKQLDSYACIYKILTYNGYIVVYASEPTEDDLTIQMKLDR